MGLAEIVGAGIILIPLSYGILLVAGKFGVGPLASYTSRVISHPTNLPASISLRDDETAVYEIEPWRTRWRRLALFGTLMLPFGWGIALLIYAHRVRKRSRYVITDQRVIEETPDDVSSYAYADIAQVQTGATVIESLFNRGHVKFSVNRRDLFTIGWLHDPEPVKQTIDDYAST